MPDANESQDTPSQRQFWLTNVRSGEYRYAFATKAPRVARHAEMFYPSYLKSKGLARSCATADRWSASPRHLCLSPSVMLAPKPPLACHRPWCVLGDKVLIRYPQSQHQSAGSDEETLSTHRRIEQDRRAEAVEIPPRKVHRRGTEGPMPLLATQVLTTGAVRRQRRMLAVKHSTAVYWQPPPPQPQGLAGWQEPPGFYLLWRQNQRPEIWACAPTWQKKSK